MAFLVDLGARVLPSVVARWWFSHSGRVLVLPGTPL